MSIGKTYCCAYRMNVNFRGERLAFRCNLCDFSKSYFLSVPFFQEHFIDILGSPIQLDRLPQPRCLMKRILSVFAAFALFAVAGAANAADASSSQPTTCQGPPSQCNVYFGQ
jgi:hypothetical protein